MGVIVHEVGPEHATASMPVAGNTQPYGLLHGGASAALAETVGSTAAVAHAGEGGRAVGMELSITHHRSMRSGQVHAEATALRLGRRTASYDIKITDDDGRLIASARLLCMVIPAKPESAEPGSAEPETD